MPILDVSELNIVLSILGMYGKDHEPDSNFQRANSRPTGLGSFIVLYGFIAVKIKQVWYLGEACQTSFAERTANPVISQH